jgi:dTDP-4-dehydrorhamnose 3,5-epimerase-like enzyme|tara:strand:+ start:1355 stop:1759 length:405 start_codon:yes stop_codon:yes gene_type:complete
MKKIRKIKIKPFKSVTGKLVPISFNKKFPFSIKRIFFLHGSKNKIRGDHAHKKCSQLFMVVSGKVILNIKTSYSEKNIPITENSKYAILVPPKYWCSVKFIKKKSILTVMTDRYYEYKDYIETFSEYKKYLLKK